MRIRISHHTRYVYDTPARSVLQMLRLTPRDSEGQHVLFWRVEPNMEGLLKPFEDAFGNLCHQFTPDSPVEDFTLTVAGEVETHDSGGVVRGTAERVPDLVFLRETPLTAADDAIRAFAADHGSPASRDPLSTLHALLAALHSEVTYDTGSTDVATSAAQAFALRRGRVSGPYSHLRRRCAPPRNPGSLRFGLFSSGGRSDRPGSGPRLQKPRCPVSGGWPSIPQTGSA